MNLTSQTLRRRLHRAAGTALLMATAVTMSALGAHAAITDWSTYTYTWTDDNAPEITHLSSLADVATTPNQMKAMIYKVYSDPTIPGLKDIRIGRNQNGSYTLAHPKFIPGMNKDDRGGDYHGVEMGWEQYGFTYTNGKPTEYTPNENGYTALLVQLKDDYNDVSQFVDHVTDTGVPIAKEPKAETIESMDATWPYIKSIEMLDRHMAVGTGTFHVGQIWGHAFNITKPLNKFFVVLKGNPGDAQQIYYHAPFYHMFEQLSPGLGEGFSSVNAYAEMVAGHKYPVDHNCPGVLTWGHMVQMLGREFDPQNPSRGGNMIVFIPANRFFGSSITNNKSFNYYASAYTHSEVSDATKPVVDYRPYFFMYTLELATPTVVDNRPTANTAGVTLTWTSSFKSVTNGLSPEEFQLMHRINGAAWAPVDMSKIATTQVDTSILSDAGLITRSADGTVTVTVTEDLGTDNTNIEYQVMGRLRNSDFAWVESGLQRVDLAGTAFSTEASLNIDVEHVSSFDVQAQQNQYTNTVGLLRATQYPIKRGHVATGDTHTTLQLVRFVASATADYTDASQGTTVATLTVNPSVDEPVDGQYIYEVTRDGQTFATLQSASSDGNDGVLEPAGKDLNTETHVFHITDQFSVSTAEGADQNQYVYRVFARNLHNGTTDALEVYSNHDFVMSHGTVVNGTYVSYSYDEVVADAGHTLAPSSAALGLSALQDPEIDHVEFQDLRQNLLGRANRSNTGDYNAFFTDGAELASAGPVPANGVIGVPASMNAKTLVAVTFTKSGNTYGSKRATVPVMPTVNMTMQSMTKEDNGVNLQTTWTCNYAASGIDYDDHHLAIRAWDDRDADRAFYQEVVTPQSSMSPLRDPGTQTLTQTDNGWSVVSNREITTEAPTATHRVDVFYRVRSYDQNPAEPGKYLVTEGNKGWGLKADGTTTGVEDIVNGADTQQSVWPTLTTGTVTVMGQGAVDVFNLSGARVAGSRDDLQSRDLDLGHLPAGMYIVTVGDVRVKVVKK